MDVIGKIGPLMPMIDRRGDVRGSSPKLVGDPLLVRGGHQTHPPLVAKAGVLLPRTEDGLRLLDSGIRRAAPFDSKIYSQRSLSGHSEQAPPANSQKIYSKQWRTYRDDRERW